MNGFGSLERRKFVTCLLQVPILSPSNGPGKNCAICKRKIGFLSMSLVSNVSSKERWLPSYVLRSGKRIHEYWMSLSFSPIMLSGFCSSFVSTTSFTMFSELQRALYWSRQALEVACQCIWSTRAFSKWVYKKCFFPNCNGSCPPFGCGLCLCLRNIIWWTELISYRLSKVVVAVLMWSVSQ